MESRYMNLNLADIVIFLFLQCLFGVVISTGIIMAVSSLNIGLILFSIVMMFLFGGIIFLVQKESVILFEETIISKDLALFKKFDEESAYCYYPTAWQGLMYVSIVILAIGGLLFGVGKLIGGGILSFLGIVMMPLALIPFIAWINRAVKGELVERKFIYRNISIGTITLFVSVLILSIIELVLFNVGIQPFFSKIITLVIFTPIFEEVLKGLVVIFLVYLACRKEIISPKMGMILGFLVGIGFTIVEDATYMIDGISRGLWYIPFLLRTLSIPLHSVGPMLIGYGFAKYKNGESSSVKSLLSGLAIGYGFHLVWNAVAVGFDKLMVIYPSLIWYIVMISVFLGLSAGIIAVTEFSLRKKVGTAERQ